MLSANKTCLKKMQEREKSMIVPKQPQTDNLLYGVVAILYTTTLTTPKIKTHKLNSCHTSFMIIPAGYS